LICILYFNVIILSRKDVLLSCCHFNMVILPNALLIWEGIVIFHHKVTCFFGVSNYDVIIKGMSFYIDIGANK
jgi:hypothetical protein